MQLFQAWAESLTLLKPANFKPFLLVTLKSIIDTYKVLFTRFWLIMLMPVFIVGSAYARGWFLSSHTEWANLFALVALLLNVMIFLLVVYLCARPSVKVKSLQYVLGYWKHFLYFCLLTAMICWGYSFVFFYRFLYVLFWISQVFAIFFMAFLLDSDARVKSALSAFKHAGIMMFYNLPFIALIIGLFVAVINGFMYIGLSHFIFRSAWIGDYALVGEYALVYAFIFLLPVIPICFFMNFYIKKLHEQFNLYFEVKG